MLVIHSSILFTKHTKQLPWRKGRTFRPAPGNFSDIAYGLQASIIDPWALALAKIITMGGVSDIASGHRGTQPDPHKAGGNTLSTGKIGSLITEMNAILRDEFYPSLGSEKTRRFDTT